MSVQQQWPVGAARAQRESAALKAIVGLFLALAAYTSLTIGAHGPGYGHVEPDIIAGPAATLSFVDGEPVITGSVASLFQAVGTFVGPNEAMKQDRLRPDVDVLALTKSFDDERTRIAALQQGTKSGVIPVPAGGVAADLVVPASPTAVSARIALASVDPSAIQPGAPETSALNAIAGAAPPPVPAVLPQQLAYARDDAPITTFPNYPTSDKYSAKDLNCLAQAVYFEARGEPYRGQVAVAQVVMNRLAHPLYPKTICAVVFQDADHRDACQFSFACDGIPEVINEPGPWKQAEDIAQKVADGELYLPEVANATHYHATYVYPDWAPHLKRVTQIGMHIFYKFRDA